MTTFYALGADLTEDALRALGSALIIFLAVLLTRLRRSKLNRNEKGESSDVLRAKLVLGKNTIRALAAAAIVLIWASKIAGVVLSVAALAGALLIVGKELLLCAMGYALVSITKPYKIGDYIEVGRHSGRVRDVNVFSTVVSETGSVNQLTGKTLSFPNSMLFAEAVRNVSATGTFIVTLYRIVVPLTVDFDRAETCALEAADEATARWLEAAAAHLECIEARIFLDLPSPRPKVLWESLNEKSYAMTIRFACLMSERVGTEQVIFRSFWKRYRLSTPGYSFSDGDAALACGSTAPYVPLFQEKAPVAASQGQASS